MILSWWENPGKEEREQRYVVEFQYPKNINTPDIHNSAACNIQKGRLRHVGGGASYMDAVFLSLARAMLSVLSALRPASCAMAFPLSFLSKLELFSALCTAQACTTPTLNISFYS